MLENLLQPVAVVVDPFRQMIDKCQAEADQRGKWKLPNQFLLYSDAVYENLRRTEESYIPNVIAIMEQPDINPRMRTILIDWLIDLHTKFK